MKNLDKIEKINKKKRIIVGLDLPKNYSEYRLLLKKIFLKQKELVNFQKYNFEFINSEELLNHNQIYYIETIDQAKKAYPLQFKITKLIDNILGKRKL
jgi:hypothetical protein